MAGAAPSLAHSAPMGPRSQASAELMCRCCRHCCCCCCCCRPCCCMGPAPAASLTRLRGLVSSVVLVLPTARPSPMSPPSMAAAVSLAASAPSCPSPPWCRSHSLRASWVLWGEPLWGSSPPSGTAALAPPQAAETEGRGSSVPPSSSLSPGSPTPSSGSSSGRMLGPAPSLACRSCRVVLSGILTRAPLSLPSSGAADPLGGLAA